MSAKTKKSKAPERFRDKKMICKNCALDAGGVLFPGLFTSVRFKCIECGKTKYCKPTDNYYCVIDKSFWMEE